MRDETQLQPIHPGEELATMVHPTPPVQPPKCLVHPAGWAGVANALCVWETRWLYAALLEEPQPTTRKPQIRMFAYPSERIDEGETTRLKISQG